MSLRKEVQTLPRRSALNGLDGRSTRIEALAALRERLAEAGVENYALDARLILCEAGEFAAEDLIRAPEGALNEADLVRLQAMAARRIAREPLSRIFGRREFWGLPLTIEPAALDPRPETETLVEATLRSFSARRQEPLRILDLGSGSGAVLCALLCEFPNAHGVAVDLSPAAAALSRVNLDGLGLARRSSVVVGRWGESLGGRFDVIVSNPPYIKSAEIGRLPPEVRCYDPAPALDGGADGLDAYRALAKSLVRLLESAGGRFFLEVGVGQAGAVAAVLKAAGLGRLAFALDLAGRARVVHGPLGAKATPFQQGSWREAKKRLVVETESSSPDSASESRGATGARDASAIERLRLTKSRNKRVDRNMGGHPASI
jgi:release factor glutamine methyltransferase